MKTYEHLLQPLKVGGLTLKNRMLSSPTSLAELGANERYSPENIAYYKLRAAGGAALVTVGDVIVDNSTGRSHPQQVGMDDPGIIPYLVQMTDAIHSGGAAASVEIDHGGSECEPRFIGGKYPIGPSAYSDSEGFVVEEMTEEQIYQVADAFGRAATIAKKCGFDMVTIHSGHGWLLHQFISELTNLRTDKWGGNIENRMRFPLLVIEKVREAVGKNFPIEFRISGSERMPGGYDIETGIEIAKAVDGKVDLIHVSAGSMLDLYSFVLMHPGSFQEHGENSYLARKIKKYVKTPVVTVGAFSEPDKMEAFLEEGGADAIAMGRALIADPFLPKKVMRGQIGEITPCLRCGECQGGMMEHHCLRCTVNPVIGREKEVFHPIPVNRTGKILIAGGGPAGMQAAITACEKGHQVVLYEERERLGGALRFADSIDFKKNIKVYREFLAHKVFRLPIEVHLGIKLTEDIIRKENPDALILALGAKPMMLSIPGIHRKNVLIAADLNETSVVGRSIAIIGGGLVGCEEAVHFGRQGHQVTVIEMKKELASDCVRTHRINLLHQIEICENIVQETSACCQEITEEGVKISKNGIEKIIRADTIILAAGMIADDEQVTNLRNIVPQTYVIGDCNKSGKIMYAVRDAYDAVTDFGLM